MPSCQPSTLAPILKYKITNHLYLLSNNFKKDISLKASSNRKKTISLLDIIGNNNENCRYVNIDQQKSTILNWIAQNGLLSDLFRNFKQIMFNKSQFPIGTPVLNTRYKHLGSQSSNSFYLFNN